MESELPPDPASTPVPAATPPATAAPVAAPVPVVQAPPTAPAYPDRSTGLMIFGILEIALGGLSALMIPFMLLGAAMSRKIAGAGMPAGSYVASICTYSFAAAALVTLGIGSIQARRWARALNLILSWAGLIFGVFATIAITAFLPRTFMVAFQQAAGNTPDAPPMSKAVIAVILTFVIVFFSIVFVIIPLAFLLFFRRKDVEETCRRRDPVERWTDRCPLPVLAVSLLFAFGGTYALLLAVTTPILPFFGRYLTGLPASAMLAALAAVDGFLAFSIYRLRLAAWWTAVTLLLLRLVSAIITYRRDDLFRAYSKMGWSQGQLDQMHSNPAFRSGLGMMWWGLILTLVFLGYLVWIKRYFRGAAPASSAATDASFMPPASGSGS